MFPKKKFRDKTRERAKEIYDLMKKMEPFQKRLGYDKGKIHDLNHQIDKFFNVDLPAMFDAMDENAQIVMKAEKQKAEPVDQGHRMYENNY